MFLTVRFNSPAAVPFRGKVQTIFVVVRLVMVPGSVVLPLTRDTDTPFLNAVPVIVIGRVPELNMAVGVREEIVGVTFVTVKVPVRLPVVPPGVSRCIV